MFVVVLLFTRLESLIFIKWLSIFSLDRAETNFFEGDPLRALSTLAFSDNVELQRSAALAFAEITEKGFP